MRARTVLGIVAAAGLAGAFLVAPPLARVASPAGDHEVWLIDQSNSRADGGGRLYIYDGAAVAGAHAASVAPEVVDLGGAAHAYCLAATGTAPVRPHMLAFSPTHSHAVIAYVATGHVLVLDGPSRAPVACIDVGAQAHAAFPSPDGRYVVVANQNGKLLQRITADFTTGAFVLEPATINLASCVTPSGAACQDPVLRPDNAPICPVVDAGSRLTFVTLRGGGMFVVDTTAGSPMAIVAEYDRATVHPNGCGGVEAAGKLYLNSGGGTAANPVEADLYAFDLAGFQGLSVPNTPAPRLVFSHDSRGFVDSHGATLAGARSRYLWVADRAANRVVVVDTAGDAVVGEIDLAGAVSADPAPDLADVSPQGHRVYVALRGPVPLTGNAPAVNNAAGATPGLGIIRVEAGGADGALQAVNRVSNVGADGLERADPHVLRVRRT